MDRRGRPIRGLLHRPTDPSGLIPPTGCVAAIPRLDDGRADLVAVGRAFLANPDLVDRLQQGAALNAADEASFYGGTDAGYIDYPTLDHTA